jgi:hypothetical protein
LLEELLAGSGKLSDSIFHFYQMIDNTAVTGSLPTARIAGEVAGSSEPNDYQQDAEEPGGYSTREGIRADRILGRCPGSSSTGMPGSQEVRHPKGAFPVACAAGIFCALAAVSGDWTGRVPADQRRSSERTGIDSRDIGTGKSRKTRGAARSGPSCRDRRRCLLPHLGQITSSIWNVVEREVRWHRRPAATRPTRRQGGEPAWLD